uniref:Uncharacterized protein n=1 Tax=Arundo donax TaxID=35708 RepID=A0A0A9EXH8_ARUDO
MSQGAGAVNNISQGSCSVWPQLVRDRRDDEQAVHCKRRGTK